MVAKKRKEIGKVKIIRWERLVDQANRPIEKKLLALFAAFDKEVANKPMTTTQRNQIWNKKYKKKYDALDALSEKTYKKLYYTYFSKNGNPKPGYKII